MRGRAAGAGMGELSEEASARVGAVLANHWWLERLVDVDMLGATYAATATSTHGNRVTLRLLHPALAASKPIRFGFLETAQLGNLVGHPGAVRCLEDDTTRDGLVFCTTEAVDAERVSDLIARRPGRIPPAEALRIAEEALEVLMAAHERGIVHGALRPEHLLIADNGTVRMCGFGTASLEAAAARALDLPVPLAMAAFASPEQARAGWHGSDRRSDCWAIGAILFALLTGEAVRPGELVLDLLARAGREPIRPLTEWAPSAPPGLVRLLEKALDLDENRRFASALRMRTAVRQVAANPEVANLSRLRNSHPPQRFSAGASDAQTRPTVSVTPPRRGQAPAWSDRPEGGWGREASSEFAKVEPTSSVVPGKKHPGRATGGTRR